WEDAADGVTRMTLRNRGEASGFLAWSAALMARAMRRANEADLRRLKDLLERRAQLHLLDPVAPVGGVKASGLGRGLGPAGLPAPPQLPSPPPPSPPPPP